MCVFSSFFPLLSLVGGRREQFEFIYSFSFFLHSLQLCFWHLAVIHAWSSLSFSSLSLVRESQFHLYFVLIALHLNSLMPFSHQVVQIKFLDYSHQGDGFPSGVLYYFVCNPPNGGIFISLARVSGRSWYQDNETSSGYLFVNSPYNSSYILHHFSMCNANLNFLFPGIHGCMAKALHATERTNVVERSG